MFPEENLRDKNGSQTTLSNPEISRYSRQLILSEIGIKGQEKLKSSRILIVGCGGLGCPAAQYLAAAGIGTLGLLDYDTVEESNLHRQVLHSEAGVGSPKSQSIAEAVGRLNSAVKTLEINCLLSSSNAGSIIRNYDVVLDATDNVATRYLLNDICVIEKKPLVSGSALRFEGQLSVYNYPPDSGTTYRCLYPTPPPPETVTNCSDGGVLGVIPGIIGTMQALEAIKIVLGLSGVLAGKLVIFDGLEGSFRTVKLRGRSSASEVKELIDYVQFCGSSANDKDSGISLLRPFQRISPLELKSLLHEVILIDVRPSVQFEIASISGSFNIPLQELNEVKAAEIKKLLLDKNLKTIVILCKRGNDSQKGVLKLSDYLDTSAFSIVDVIGGITQWSLAVDSSVPLY